jgi:hypothetical protein
MRSLATTLAALLLAVGLSLATGVVIPHVAVACSCIGPQPLAAYAGEETVIFAGEIVSDDSEGLLIDVEQWFSGDGAAPVQLIAGDFGNGASCGIGMRPAVGSRWLVVAWRPPDGSLLPDLPVTPVSISICQPFLDLDTPEGAALLAEAMDTFGDGAGIPSSPESPGSGPADSPAAPATTGPTASATPAADDGPSAETLALVAAVGTLAIGAGVLVVVLLVARRRTTGGGTAAG